MRPCSLLIVPEGIEIFTEVDSLPAGLTLLIVPEGIEIKFSISPKATKTVF